MKAYDNHRQCQVSGVRGRHEKALGHYLKSGGLVGGLPEKPWGTTVCGLLGTLGQQKRKFQTGEKKYESVKREEHFFSRPLIYIFYVPTGLLLLKKVNWLEIFTRHITRHMVVFHVPTGLVGRPISRGG